jgi:dihydropteroate synthase
MLYYFSEKVVKARSLGINDLIIDPGFGFKKQKHYEVLRQFISDVRITCFSRVSRKSMIYKTLGTDAGL